MKITKDHRDTGSSREGGREGERPYVTKLALSS